MTRRRFANLLALLVPLAVNAAEVRCASAESMAGLMTAWTQGFTALHASTPARVTRPEKFSAAAFEALLRGEVDVVPFSREPFPSERARYAKKFGGTPLLVPIATGSRDTKGGTHAIAIFVNEKNPLTRLSLAQLREIFARDGRITTWGQLGLTGGWTARKISLHGMVVRRETGDPPGVVNFLEQRLLAGREWRGDVVAHADVPNGPQGLELIVRAVAADEGALGYSGFAYAQPGTKTLALAAGSPEPFRQAQGPEPVEGPVERGETDAGSFFAGTPDEVARRAYPLARTIYLCVRSTPDETTRAFIRHALSPAGQRAIAEDTQKFFPLPTDTVATALREVAR